ncbi:hypothetical protein EV356DRAFT_565788 [Viridothelium virens]|uniref:Uncharacterized protein n=1 Tax=Viridothelium virens TaxID=1048519 RepID=A0A6A6HEV4_VIRVR|nr:hypothetical protein EV356DRAFT_565788 [Viridothelium virens]
MAVSSLFEVPLPSTPTSSASHSQFRTSGASEDSLRNLMDVPRYHDPALLHDEYHDVLSAASRHTDEQAFLLPHEKLPQLDPAVPLLPHETTEEAPTFAHEEVNAEDVVGDVEIPFLGRGSVSGGPRRRSSTSALRPAPNTSFVPILPEAVATEVSQTSPDQVQPNPSAKLRRTSSAPHFVTFENTDPVLANEESVSPDSPNYLDPIAEVAEEDVSVLPRRLSLPALDSFTEDPAFRGGKHVAFMQTSMSLPQSPRLIAKDTTWAIDDDDDELESRNSIVLYDISRLQSSDFNKDGFPWRELLESAGQVYLYPRDDVQQPEDEGDDEEDEDDGDEEEEDFDSELSDFDDEEDQGNSPNPWITGSHIQRSSTSHFPGLARLRTQTNFWATPSHHETEDFGPESCWNQVVDNFDPESIDTKNVTSIYSAPPTAPPNSHDPSTAASPSVPSSHIHSSPALSPNLSALPGAPPSSPQPPTRRSEDFDEVLHGTPMDLPMRVQRTLGVFEEEDAETAHFKAHKDSLELAALRLARERERRGRGTRSEGESGRSGE